MNKRAGLIHIIPKSIPEIIVMESPMVRLLIVM